MSDFYGIRLDAHPHFVEDGHGGYARWGELPEREQKEFTVGLEALWRLYDELGAETFGRCLRFVAAEERGIAPTAETLLDFDAEPEFALG